ncbi:hypothetical protein [Rhodococcus opacus]|uniref:Uncharacterized protein n=1 Tax=Rhodococcus opacus TaxID=37919 RepID=A0A2S8J6I7_RHOOP|nr:hypothetical protein [Rhodococcus opacus]PQP22593.1 hypothetical protein C5613_23345 [Rhodococcus opacus]
MDSSTVAQHGDGYTIPVDATGVWQGEAKRYEADLGTGLGRVRGQGSSRHHSVMALIDEGITSAS